MQERRRRIDEIDGQIVMLLNRRAVEVKQVAQIKAAAGLPLVDERRESEVYRRVAAGEFRPNRNGISATDIQKYCN
jgi:chorismate mutase